MIDSEESETLELFIKLKTMVKSATNQWSRGEKPKCIRTLFEIDKHNAYLQERVQHEKGGIYRQDNNPNQDDDR